MTRYNYDQHWGASCAAVCAMITSAEFGIIGEENLHPYLEETIWQNIRRYEVDDQGAPQETVTPVPMLANFFNGNGMQATIYEDPAIVRHLRAANTDLNGEYLRHRSEVSATGYPSQEKALCMADFHDGARIVLTVGFYRPDELRGTHNILARRDGDDIFVMNPDGGTDQVVPYFWDWARLPGYVKDIGGVRYFFTGVYIRVTRA